ncbi:MULTISPECIES: MurR/RpiR family transcriptional regulator [Saccharibacillus]|uniref:MurR/RpiR family transcriptional regulator n=1 Tax=Saccharibacillus TaxID=456492 RepID=UPI0013667504|nr:MurR/RpiR family transcriptional regulator [Saccharibacillus sp. WB 17]
MLLEKLRRADGWSGSERAIADYVLQHREKVLGMTIRELSEATYSSNPTIVRLCRKLGVSGFREFKIVLSSEFERTAGREEVDANLPFRKRHSSAAIAGNIAELTQSTVREAAELLGGERLDKAAALLGAARGVYLFAAGDSMVRALGLQGKLLKINRPVQISSLMQEQGYHAYNASAGDCAVFITYGGLQAGYADYAAEMKSKGVGLIAVTANSEGCLAALCDVVLPLPIAEEPMAKIGTFSSQIAIDYVLNVLYSCVFNLRYEENFAIKQSAQAYVERIDHS